MMEFVNGKDDIPYTIDNKTCLKWKNKKSSKKNKLSSPVTHQVTVSFINPSRQRHTTELRRWRHMPCQLRKLLEQAAARARKRRREEQRPQTVTMHRGFFDESVQNTWISDGEVGIRLGHIMKIMIDIIYEFHIYIYICGRKDVSDYWDIIASYGSVCCNIIVACNGCSTTNAKNMIGFQIGSPKTMLRKNRNGTLW